MSEVTAPRPDACEIVRATELEVKEILVCLRESLCGCEFARELTRVLALNSPSRRNADFLRIESADAGGAR